jgi:hypothetical protein
MFVREWKIFNVTYFCGGSKDEKSIDVNGGLGNNWYCQRRIVNGSRL